MGKLMIAVVLIGISGFVEFFSWTYPFLWFVGIAPIDFINGCRFAALGLIVYAAIKANRFKAAL